MYYSIILPTYNESENIPLIIPKIEKAMESIPHEVLVVDDNSPDGTYELACDLKDKHPNIRAICRLQNKGLSAAIIDGFLNARGEFMIVMDADMQHDETKLPLFIEKFTKGHELVIGSRKTEGGGIRNWSYLRRLASSFSTFLAHLVLPKLCSDPMSGYFGVSKKFFNATVHKVNARGFKILLEFLMHSKEINVAEVGYFFSPRVHGSSKLSPNVMLQFLVGLYELRFGRIISLRFIKFAMVGLTGVVVNQGSLWVFISLFSLQPNIALALAIELSIISNFFLNNYFTFYEVRLKTFGGILRGLFTFNLICLIGGLINYAIVYFLTQQWQMNIYISNFIGIFVTTLWNYTINLNSTWQKET